MECWKMLKVAACVCCDIIGTEQVLHGYIYCKLSIAN